MRVELKDIRKYFGPVRANDGISLTFEGGKIYGLLGENGAGKSTLMKILSGYQPPDSGRILLDQEHVHFSSPATALANGVGMVYQDPLDMPPFRVIDNYLLGRDRRVRLNYKDARAELQEGLHLIAQRIHEPKQAGKITWRPFPGIWGPSSLPVTFIPG